MYISKYNFSIITSLHCSHMLLQALKLLRTAQFRPLVVFIKAASSEGVHRLHTSARVDNKQGHSMLTVSTNV